MPLPETSQTVDRAPAGLVMRIWRRPDRPIIYTTLVAYVQVTSPVALIATNTLPLLPKSGGGTPGPEAYSEAIRLTAQAGTAFRAAD
jgi:hypothetical protein